MRVLELSQRYPPALGGVEATLEELALGLRRAGVDVGVVTTDVERDRPFTRRTFDDSHSPVPITRVRAHRLAPLPLGLGIVAPGMLFAAAEAEADLVHAHAFGYAPTWIGALLRRARRRPFVVTPHADPGRGLAFSRLYHRMVAGWTLGPADRVIVQSGIERAFLLGLGVPEDRLVRIPTGISLAPFAGMPGSAGDDRLRLLTVGRLDVVQKGLATLVEALAQLPASVRWEARLLGDDWGGAAVLRDLAGRRGVGDRIRIEGPATRAEILAAYRDADVFVLPSRFESFPRSVLEAMAAGLPIVATRVGGVPEIVAEGSNALLVPPDDPGALARGMAEIASDAGRRRAFGRVSRSRASEYSWENLIPRYVALFQELLARDRSR